ncbi:MAG: ABC transporter permease [Anaerolineaceae bacterium]|jgi:putative ABC transport system permease protein|nr:ABC transporter permease [Anaerolineaceae bacterium]
MRFWDLLSLILSNLNRRKGRVVLTAMGVVIGTAAVVLLVSLASGLQKNAASQLGGIGDLTAITVYPNYGEGGPGFMGPGMMMESGGPSTAKMLTNKTIEEITALPGVKSVIPRDSLRMGGILRFGKMENYAYLLGVGTDDLSVFEYPVQEGELQLARGTAVIGGWAAKNFYNPNLRPGQEMPEQPDLLGQTVKLVLMKWTEDGEVIEKTVPLRIVGVLSEVRGEQDSALYVRLEDITAWNEWAMGQRINRNRDGYETLIVKANSVDEVLAVADSINALGYMANTPQSFVQGINSFFIVLQLIFGGVGAIALLVAAIGIANTMTMAILERTREIGLMKAVGASNRDVLTIFLGEAAGIGLVGGIGGVLLGWGGGQILNVVALSYLANRAATQGGLPPSFAISTPLWLPIFALLFATLVGLLSGLYPALHAATLQPVSALKYE